MKTMVKSVLAILVLSRFMANLGGIGPQDFLTVDWPQDGSRADLHLTAQLLPSGQIQLTWVPYADVSTYVIYGAYAPLPVNSAGWSLAGETTGSTFVLNATDPRRFWHVRPKVVMPPVFLPPSGFYPAGQQLALSTFPPGSWIMYKLDYQNSTAPSFSYSTTPLPTVGAPATIRAWAVKTGWADSEEAFGVFSTPPQIYQVAPLANTLQTVVDDMILPGEGFPHGVDPYWDWYDEGVVHQALPLPQHQAFTAWGAFYEETRGNPAANTRVLIRNLRAAYLSSQDNLWHSLQDNGSGIVGKWYREDFAADSSWVADTLYLPDGSISAAAGNGRNFHFWIQDRASLGSLPIAGIFVTLEAKLILDEPSPDDRLNARYIMAAGGDYWSSVTGGTNAGGDIGSGRFKYVTTEWKSFNFCTLSQSQMVSNPPPVLP